MATRIESVLEALRGWNYPIDMKATGGCKTAPPIRSSAPSENPATPRAGAGAGQLLDNNVNAPVQLGYGTSARYRLNGPSRFGVFTFIPESHGPHSISAVSEPNHIDLGWQLYTSFDLDTPIQECDNDVPQRGTETCQVNLQAGQLYYLGVSNITGDEPGEPAEPLDFTVTISAVPGASAPPGSQGGSGTINLAYIPDQAGCGLNIAIQFERNNRTITPTGNYVTLNGMTLGQENYSIYGNITCPMFGFSCVASGADTLYLEDGGTYNVMWQDAGAGMCGIGLFDLQ